jgi:hypothetical protein
MALCIIENEQIQDDWFRYLKLIREELLAVKDIQKPHEDINDAVLIYNILKNQKNS